MPAKPDQQKPGPDVLVGPAHSAIPLWLVPKGGRGSLDAALPPGAAAYLTATRFDGKAGALALLPGDGKKLGGAVFGLGDTAKADAFLLGRLPKDLPAGTYRLASSPTDMGAAALAWCLGAYSFSRYKAAPATPAKLVVEDPAIRARALLLGDAVGFGRDLINTPANDMGPTALAAAALDLAKAFGAKARATVGEALLKQNFPLIHAVGRASADQPRLIDFTWGDPKHPKVTLVGKGVCFDTGGLDIKPSSGMLLMKKDMGGAATALTAARMIMAAGLKVRLRVLVPIVENAISSNAFRPSDVIRSRKGLTVEIGNTDAEGRLILADALALASEESPDLIIDYATLTGAARVALGPDLPPFYTDDEALAADIAAAGTAVNDPVWRLPLWPAYDRYLDSKVADLSSTGSGGMAGSVTAALFLKRFVGAGIPHAHFDIYGWVPSAKPGRPEGGEPQASRLTFALLEKRYG
jgi:leucyl aminopeptidase